ncbi:MAG: TlyA family rRNA (cytidine-2'-O)-methyltransferase [bacterium]
MELLPVTEADRWLTVALETDPRVMAELGGPWTTAEAEATHARRLGYGEEHGSWLLKIVPDAETGPVGTLMLWDSERAGEPISEAGWMVLPERCSGRHRDKPRPTGVCHHEPVTGVRASRVRLDQLIADRGLAESRSRAQALLLGGRVRVGVGDAARLDRKPGDLVDPEIALDVQAPEPYVSRGGHKLAAALDAFGVQPAGRICLDAGASTGGFTDVLLQRGARRVYAIDVGRGQLAEALRRDARVISMERTNARGLTPATLPEPVSLATVDVSFISLRLVLAPIASTFGPDGGDLIPLVKPQFEAGRGEAKGGVVRDPELHARVLREVTDAAVAAGLAAIGQIESPILGPEGNREFLLHLRVPKAA